MKLQWGILAVAVIAGCCDRGNGSPTKPSGYMTIEATEGTRTVVVFDQRTGMLAEVYSVPRQVKGLGSMIEPRVGQSLQFHSPSGALVARGFYDAKGRLSGSLEQWDPRTGALLSVRNYEKGRELGHSVSFTDGQVECIRYVKPDGSASEISGKTIADILSGSRRQQQ